MTEQLRNLAVGTLLAALANPALCAPARACSIVPCDPGSYHLEPDSVVPANAPGLLWRDPMNYAAAGQPMAELHLTRIDGAAEIDVPISVEDPMTHGDHVVHWSEPLVAGARYRLSVDGSECSPDPIELTAGDEAPLPIALGDVGASEPERGYIEVATVSGSCTTQLPAVVSDVSIELSDEATPWASLLQYTTYVDGKPWSPQWSLGGSDVDFGAALTKVFAECAGTLPSGDPIDKGAAHDGLPQGEHEIWVEATIPGSSEPIASKRVTIDLQCDAPAAEPDASAPDRDAGHGTVHAKRTTPDSDGCAVRVAGGNRGSGRSEWIALACALAWVLKTRLRPRIRR